MLLIVLHGLLPMPRDLYFSINELNSIDFYLCDFDICDPLVLLLYGDVFLFA